MKSNPPPCQQPKRAVGGEAQSAISMAKIIIDVSEKREEHRLKKNVAVNTTAPSLERAARPTWRSMAQTTSPRWAKKAAKPPGSGLSRPNMHRPPSLQRVLIPPSQCQYPVFSVSNAVTS